MQDKRYFYKKSLNKLALCVSFLVFLGNKVNAEENLNNETPRAISQIEDENAKKIEENFISLDELKKFGTTEKIVQYVEETLEKVNNYKDFIDKKYNIKVVRLMPTDRLLLKKKKKVDKNSVELKKEKLEANENINGTNEKNKEVILYLSCAAKYFCEVKDLKQQIEDKIRDKVFSEFKASDKSVRQTASLFLENPQKYLRKNLEDGMQSGNPMITQYCEKVLNSQELFDATIKGSTAVFKSYLNSPADFYEERFDSIMNDVKSKAFYCETLDLKELFYSIYEKIIEAYKNYQEAEKSLKKFKSNTTKKIFVTYSL